MAHVSEIKTAISKLDDTNYQLWKFKLEMLLSRDDLWDVVTNEAPSAPNEEWIKKNRQARATISLLVEDNQLIHIRKLDTAKEMWDALRNLHERSNLCSKLYLLRKLYGLRLEGDRSMRDHINQMLEIVDQLRGIGENLKDNHVAALLLCSLPESYSTLITALEARPEQELTLEIVRGKLMDEHERRKEGYGRQKDNRETVLKAGQRYTGGPRKENDTTNDRQRYNCEPRRDSRTCFYCNKIGHLKKNCRALKYQNMKDQHKAKGAIKSVQNQPSTDNDDSKQDFCFTVNSTVDISGWYVDSGATGHMTCDRGFFSLLREFNNDEEICLADGRKIKAIGTGDGYLKCKTNSQEINIHLCNVLYVPELEGNLISVKRLAGLGYDIHFKGMECLISQNSKVVAVAKLDPHLYKLQIAHKSLLVCNQVHVNCIHLWHRRLGHHHPAGINKLNDEKLANGIELNKCDSISRCTCCIISKMTQKPFPKVSYTRATKPFELIHSDVCGPMRTITPSGNRYFLVLVDDYSRYTEIYLLKRKSEVEEKLMTFLAKGNNKFQRNLKILRTDGGGEFMSKELEIKLQKQGIERQITVPHSPQQNGVAERKNRSIVEMARCMLKDAGLNNEYWGEAVTTAVYLQNRLFHRSCTTTPYELWNGKPPDISHVRVFGCKAFAHTPPDKQHKFSDRAQEGILMGYSSTAKGYRILLKDTNRIVISRSVIFDEHSDEKQIYMPVENKTLQPKLETTVNVNIADEAFKNQDMDILRRSQRVNKGIPAEKLTYFAQANLEIEPVTWDEMMDLPEIIKDRWLNAIKEEMDSLEKNNTWELVPLPPGRTPIGCRWVFKLKGDAQGNQYKARLVAKGYLQKFGEDYDAIFAPVVKYPTVRALLAIAAKRQMKTKHMDVKTAFLNGSIEESIYMEQPKGLLSPQDNLVCKLKRSIYGLKQSAKIWNDLIDSKLQDCGFSRGKADPCLYTKNNKGNLTYILIYVDDILICGDTWNEIDKIKQILESSYDMKDLGEVKSYLGIQVDKIEDGNYLLHQTYKIENMLMKYGLQDARATTSPMDINYMKITENDTSLFEDTNLYRKVVGELLYISTISRPDIATAIGILARKVEKPRQSDFIAIKRILRYLKGTLNRKIILDKSVGFDLIGFADADWASDTSDRKSTSGYLFCLGNSLIAWASKKQACVTLSSTEAEFVSASCAGQEAIWLRRLMDDFQYTQLEPTIIYEDNQGCIKLSVSEKHHARTKHIDVRQHFLKDLQDQNIIRLQYCPTEEMLADVFTKPLAGSKFTNFIAKLNMVDFPCD